MNFGRQRGHSRRNSLNTMINTEKWRSFPKRMSRVDSDFTEEESSSENDQPKTDLLKDWTEEFFSRNNESIEQIDQDVEICLTKKQTLLLATLVPDEILLLDNFDEKAEPKRFVGVLLMADVSGYTALSERYTNTGKGGTYRLTVTLNTYLGSLIEVIYTHGGDILKFAGDAFLALWKTDKSTFLNHTIHTAIACALVIQHSFGSYETDVKVNLKVKLAIAAGNLLFATIGKGIDMNYIIIGLPVLEAKTAESLCMSGEVRLTPTAWGHCYSRNYDYIVHDDGHVTIRSILYDPREKDVTKPFLGFGGMIRQVKKPFIGIENLPETILDVNKTKNCTESRNNDILNLRRTILTAEENNIGSQIRKFMIRPVLTQIDAHQPLEYLTEMRYVSVLFVTLKPSQCPFPQLITIVNKSYQITCDIVYKSMGCVNKIILFDKDIMILVIFGLRGFKHESEAQAALKCASGIKKSLSALDGVIEVSIGVTTGQVYCGVVGHPLRREFTVIGAVVNKAARFMCYFRNKITCDETTFVKSKMSSNGFTLQPTAELKGINHPGKVYEYNEEIRVKELFDIPVVPPLLNRIDEFEYFKNWIDECHLSYRDFDALLFVGDLCSGKTRLLQWLRRYVKNRGLRICHLNLSSIHSATPYLALSQIINQMLDLKEPIKGFAKEEKIVELVHAYNTELCYLNNKIKVRFAYHEGIYSEDEDTRQEKSKNIFLKLVSAFHDACVIFLDDIQNLDASSWEYISIMLNVPKIYVILTLTRGKFNTIHSWLYNVFINSNIRKIVLGPLPSNWIPPLACQILDVEAVPKDLCETLKAKCKGLPGLVESFIVHMFSNGALEIKKIPKFELESLKIHELQFPDRSYLELQAVNIDDQETLEQLMRDNSADDISVCIVTKKEELNTNINEQNLDTIIMVQIDSLTPYQQLLLKIASVIGNVLSRNLLENIMYENNPITTAKAIKRLFAMSILSCANVRYRLSRRMTKNISSITSIANTNLTCDCCFEHDPEENENLPKYAFCKVMKFRNKNSRKTCYELLPINQKKEFHSRIVNYLEKNKQKCPDCGGTIMILQSITDASVIGNDSKRSSIIKMEYSKNSISTLSDKIDAENAVVEYPSEIINRDSFMVRRTRSDGTSKESEQIPVSSEKIRRADSIRDKTTSRPLTILKSKSENLDSLSGMRRSTKRVTMSNFLYKDVINTELETLKIFDMLRPVTEASTINDWHQLGVIDSNDNVNENSNKFFKLNIEKGVSKTNFDKCSCLELNITIYEQLIYHAKEADLKIKVVEFLIKYCHFNLLSNNFDCIYPKLDEAEELCTEKHVDYLDMLNKRRFLGKIYSIRAGTLLMCGNLVGAKLQLDRATKIYGFNLDRVSDFFNIRNLISATTLRRHKYLQHNMTMKSDSLFYLNVASSLFSALGDDRTARISAIRALNLTQKVECNVIDLCDTFSNAIQVEIARGNAENTENIELMAISTFKNLSRPVQAEEMFAVGKFFLASFRARMTRGNLPAAIRSGFRALTISRFLHADKISLEIIPDLFYILLSRRRIEEAIDLLNSLQYSHKTLTTEWETWYYALCIDLILDAGFQLESPNAINQFAEHALHKGLAAGPSRRRLIIGLWTYWLRAEADRKAKHFESEALFWTAYEDEDGTLNTLFSSMRLAEGMLESLARKMDDLRKVVDLMELRSIADRELIRLEKDCRLMRTAYPRWLLLKSYSLSLSGRQNSAMTTSNHVAIEATIRDAEANDLATVPNGHDAVTTGFLFSFLVYKGFRNVLHIVEALPIALVEARRVFNRLEEELVSASISKSRLWIQNARTANFMQWGEGSKVARSSWHRIMYGMNSTRT